jgi:uncharacterized protein
MNPDLDRLIKLQQLETAAEDARRKIAEHPSRVRVLDDRVQAARNLVADGKARLAAAQERRRVEEKEVATVQARLAKYKDQLLELKTNREYQTMLHEIETAQNDIRTREDRVLEIMMETDELSAEIKKNEGELKMAEKEAAVERGVLDTELAGLQAIFDKTREERTKLVAQIDRGVLNIFETTAKGRKGVAVAEARGGLCTICHVRLRPQVFNEVTKNASIIQCDSCRRILYFAGNSESSSPVPQGS